ncbi:Valine--tRNA ligase [bioreactor metagenome]|uniref:valine--tRNA ligase n=1 Tax=bioreactor metagenome TaxID=1076179 RepID=A0A644VJZ7_9ZZZZ
MSDFAAKYDPKLIEDKWYDKWIKDNLFHSEPDEREPYCIVIPPPNVTGILHMGHMLNNTIQDVLVRRARMQGKNACWVPGTDHASIATEAKVVAKLKEEGIDKKNLTRDEFLSHAWQWKEKHGGIILEQLKKLGASCDWQRTRFTMEDALYESVIDVFVDLYNKGLIYRGIRMVNWDPKALTALSDEEVIFKEQNSKLYYLKYKIETEDNFVVVATTRPETILGDTAVCVHPEDERYSHLKGKKVIIPIVNRAVPIIFDEYVDREFGTGALKITPAHDINDYTLGLKHKLDSIDIFNDNGTLNQFGMQYEGMDRFDCRKKIVEDLREEDLMFKEEDYINKIGCSERTDAVIEPKLSVQWFLKMEDISKEALRVVEDDEVKFHPAKFKNTYRHWMENVKDWCISRQLWWGQRIPAYYLPNKEIVVAKSSEEALKIANEKFPNENYTLNDLKQDEDVLDTWFSSWLWPISVFDGIRYPENKDIQYYYPTNDLITAPEILFFWVARMIIAGLEYKEEIPFKNVYLTGIVRDKQGRKMSKSLGNSPDPIGLIENYGADGVRVGMLMSSPAGNDLLFDESYCEQGRNFSNKIWNALRLIKGWEIADIEQPQHSKIAIDWFREKLNETLIELEDDFAKYRLSESLMKVYKLIWDDFCSWFLEIIKPAYQMPIDKETYNQTIMLFEDLMKVLHPYMPFLTEEIYHIIGERNENDYIMIAQMPKTFESRSTIVADFAFAQEKIAAMRQVRNEKNIAQKIALELFVKESSNENKEFDGIITKLCNISNLEYISDKKEGALSLMVRTSEMFIPLGDTINKEEEIKKLQQDLKYYEGFAKSVKGKLSNEKFVSGAPAQVVENERKKLSDAEQKISSITEQLKSLL